MLQLAQTLLATAVSLLLAVQSNPNLSDSARNQAIQTANQAITYANQVLAGGQNPAVSVLRLVSPNGGEVWPIGTTHAISWRGPTTLQSARLILNSTAEKYVGGEAQGYVPVYQLVIKENLPNSGSYNWTIPAQIPAGTYNIHVDGYDSGIKNYSFDDTDAFFTISAYAGAVTKVKIALLAEPAADTDRARMQGCDLVVMSERTIPYTNMPLNAAMKELFRKAEPWPYTENSSGNYISSQNNLFFDKATLTNGVAKIYLTGSVSLGGECSDPRLDIVIDNTAKQFPSVRSVETYVNGIRWTAPNERGY